MSTRIQRLLAAFPARTVRPDGCAFSYREGRGGERAAAAVVLLHGIGSGSASWVHQLAGLGDAFRVVAWDAPGYGESAPLVEPWPTARHYADALTRFCDGIGLDRFLLVGHSLGALMAAAFAATRGGRLLGLVLADPAAGYGDDPETGIARLEERLETMDRLGPRGLAEERAARLLSPAAAREALDLVRWNLSRLRPDGYAQAARMLARGRLLDDARAYGGPVLVVCGSEDSVTPPAGARRLAAALSRAEYREIPGAGHASYVERPEAFDRLIRAFLETAT